MKSIFSTLLLVIVCSISFAQKVYQIRADSVRIYNTCDTAELILENRTRNLSGYLFNKGAGRTEFRKIKLQQIGNSKIAIIGQDTLDISTMKNASVDTIYRKGDSIVYVKNGINYYIPAPSNINLSTTLANNNNTGNNSIIFNKTLSGANMLMDLQQGFAMYSDNIDATTIAVGKRLWVDAPDSGSMVLGPRAGAAYMNRIRLKATNIRLEGTGGKFNNIGLLGTDTNGDLVNNTAMFAPASGAANYIQNQVIAAQTGNSWISGTSVMGRAAIYGTPDGPLRDIDIFNGTSALGANLRWSVTKTDAEAANNQGTNLNFNRYDNAGLFLGTALRLVRSSGVVDMPTGFIAATSSRIRGSDTGNLNSSYIAFMEKDGATRTGFVGKTSTVNRDVNLLSDNGNVVLIPNYNGLKGVLTVQPTTLNYDGGSLILSNTNTNNMLFSNVGFAAPAMANRSIGARIILSSWVGATATDYAIGMESNHIWQSVSTASNSLGFKFYGGTAIAARLGGGGQLEVVGQGRFKGWYDGSSPSYNLAGPAAELGVVSGSNLATATMIGYDRTANTYIPVAISGGTTASNQRSFVIDGGGYKFPSLANATVLGTDANGYLISTPVSAAISANTIAQRDASSALYASGFFQSSKASLKKNIADFNDDALSLLMKVRIKQFIYKDDPAENLRIGIIADSTDWHFATKRHDKFDTNSSLAITMKAIQELYQQNQQLRQENDALKIKLEAILQRMETIEAQLKK